MIEVRHSMLFVKEKHCTFMQVGEVKRSDIYGNNKEFLEKKKKPPLAWLQVQC